MLEVELVRESKRLLALREDWWSLGRSLNYWTPFQTPEWLFTWWEHFGGGEMRVLAFRSDRQLVGIIPLFLHDWNGNKQLTLIGSGITDYLDPAISPTDRDAVLDSLYKYLSTESEWAHCDWQDLTLDCPLRRLRVDSNFVIEIKPDQPCSTVPIKGRFAEYWDQRPRGLRRNVRRYGEKARNVSPPLFSFSVGLDSELLEALIRLHTLRWQRQGESGMIAANRSAQFLREVTRRLSSLNMCAFFSMRLEGRVVAVILSFPYRGTLFSYLSGFDAEYEYLGLGRLLLYYALQCAFDQGFQSWNFLRGEEAYKFEWGAQLERKSRVIIRRMDARR